jgi:hypothetical protein
MDQPDRSNQPTDQSPRQTNQSIDRSIEIRTRTVLRLECPLAPIAAPAAVDERLERDGGGPTERRPRGAGVGWNMCACVCLCIVVYDCVCMQGSMTAAAGLGGCHFPIDARFGRLERCDTTVQRPTTATTTAPFSLPKAMIHPPIIAIHTNKQTPPLDPVQHNNPTHIQTRTCARGRRRQGQVFLEGGKARFRRHLIGNPTGHNFFGAGCGGGEGE